MEKYSLIVVVEGDVNQLLEFKNLITSISGNFDPHSYFRSFSLPNDKSSPKELLFGNYDFFTPNELIIGDSSKIEFESFWNRSINGTYSGKRSSLFQLKISFEAISLFQSEWYTVSLKFPELLIYVSFSDFNVIYSGDLVFTNGKVYRSITNEYYKDRAGFSICLDKNLNWLYVRPLKLKMEGLQPIFVDHDRLVPLVDQLSQVVDPIEFCSHFPIESFPGWLLNDEHYFEPRPNTVFYPYPLKATGPDSHLGHTDFDYF